MEDSNVTKNADDLIDYMPLEDGRMAYVYPLTFGRARLCVGQPNTDWFEDGW